MSNSSHSLKLEASIPTAFNQNFKKKNNLLLTIKILS